jgi:hypothetical protein
MTDKKPQTETTNPAAPKTPINGKRVQPKRPPRVIRDPAQVAQLVMLQLDAVNAKKDELTIAIKGLADVTRQLARAYGENMRAIQALQQKVAKLENKEAIK